MVRRRTLEMIATHPLTARRPMLTLARMAGWQIGSRLVHEHIHPWICGTKLAVSRGMYGATGNIYFGLHEYSDMSFVLHMLREGDTFIDGGANVGTYTVLASGVCGANTISFEPFPPVVQQLWRNIDVNRLRHRVSIYEVALSDGDGEIAFTDTYNITGNRVAQDGKLRVKCCRLDGIADAHTAVLLKLDLEGHEPAALRGAREVLRSPSLLAVETELGEEGVPLLQEAGFSLRWYDPASRTLSTGARKNSLAHNLLFIRDGAEERVLERIRSAPKRTILGERV